MRKTFFNAHYRAGAAFSCTAAHPDHRALRFLGLRRRRLPIAAFTLIGIVLRRADNRVFHSVLYSIESILDTSGGVLDNTIERTYRKCSDSYYTGRF